MLSLVHHRKPFSFMPAIAKMENGVVFLDYWLVDVKATLVNLFVKVDIFYFGEAIVGCQVS